MGCFVFSDSAWENDTIGFQAASINQKSVAIYHKRWFSGCREKEK